MNKLEEECLMKVAEEMNDGSGGGLGNPEHGQDGSLLGQRPGRRESIRGVDDNRDKVQMMYGE